MKNPYKILNVNKDATFEEIKSAYKKLKIEWHPDRHGGSKDAEERFKEIGAAYDFLSSTDKKRAYDLGFNVENGSFDTSVISQNLLDPDEFIKTFATLFGDYLDSRIPGGIRTRVNKASDEIKRKKKDKIKCKICKDSGRVKLKQGPFNVYISCRSCVRV